jgi:hypothetical protein
MLCVIFNSAAPAGARPLMATRLGAATQEEKRSPTRDNGKKSKCAKFHRNHSRRCGRRFKAERRESCRIIRHLGSESDRSRFICKRACFATVPHCQLLLTPFAFLSTARI